LYISYRYCPFFEALNTLCCLARAILYDPPLVANFVPEGIEVMRQFENGLLGMGQFPTEEEIGADLINSGKQTVTRPLYSARLNRLP